MCVCVSASIHSPEYCFLQTVYLDLTLDDVWDWSFESFSFGVTILTLVFLFACSCFLVLVFLFACSHVFLTLCWAQHGRLFTSCRAGLVELRSVCEHTGSFAQLL